MPAKQTNLGRAVRLAGALGLVGILTLVTPNLVEPLPLAIVLNIIIAGIYTTAFAMASIPNSVDMPFGPSMGARMFLIGCGGIHLVMAGHLYEGGIEEYVFDYHTFFLAYLQIVGGFWFNLWVLFSRIRHVRFMRF